MCLVVDGLMFVKKWVPAMMDAVVFSTLKVERRYNSAVNS